MSSGFEQLAKVVLADTLNGVITYERVGRGLYRYHINDVYTITLHWNEYGGVVAEGILLTINNNGREETFTVSSLIISLLKEKYG